MLAAVVSGEQVSGLREAQEGASGGPLASEPPVVGGAPRAGTVPRGGKVPQQAAECPLSLSTTSPWA